ncbi:hypothetical protein JJQ72_13815 [Paenibacillus sp. F411]|uniref:Uncharacterized protein n=1 Tax=Paenibacillus algicola TaxID=2565926 RepID=A0A4P8XIV5_9BACL|nr:hypothetical protein [Paenibacillus algicola]MBO2945049.1 hypothetical protein [Paenibacillus sp. F411]QCT02536.1 hypothetical protein E6C60_1821 [Paenibacillus algicola]
MKTSSFIYGVIVGAAVYRMMSKRGISMMSMVKSGNLDQLTGGAKDKMKDLAGNTANGGGSHNGSSPSTGSRFSSPSPNVQHGVSASDHSKAANLNMLKDFIKKNPDVKHEVEQILNETHTVIPGL